MDVVLSDHLQPISIVITFMLGWGSGVITTFAFFKDHARRIGLLEEVAKSNVTRLSKSEQDVAVLFQHVRDVEAKAN